MALNLKNPEVEQLAAEVAGMTGETKTEAVRRALEERRTRLAFQVAERRSGERFLHYLEDEVWPRVPADELGRPLTRAEREEILGYGQEGV